MNSSFRYRLEEWFCQSLNGYVGEVVFSPSRADTADVRPPYGVVVLKNAKETITESNIYECEISIALLTTIDLSTSDEHGEILRALQVRLDTMERTLDDPLLGVFGYSILGTEDVQGDEDDSFADVVTLRCGAGWRDGVPVDT
jgi:hypothetical protein